MTEPFAWFRCQQGDRIYYDSKKWDDCQPLYTHPKEWVGLTDGEIDQLAIDAGIITWIKRVYDDVDKKFYDLPLGEGMEGDGISLKQFADLISKRLKEKNT